jgi:hypothetical protein
MQAFSSSFLRILFALFCHRSVRKKKTDCEGFVSAMRTASLKKTPKASLTILLMFKFKASSDWSVLVIMGHSEMSNLIY